MTNRSKPNPSKLYEELAAWWPVLSNPADYADEATLFLQQLSGVAHKPGASLLELGSGGGNNALHMKGAFTDVTLVDLSAQMLAVSQQLNPDCEHLQGDMRSFRTDRTFDAVFIHDAIDYMQTESDLKQAIETANVHCKPGGMVLLVPDHVLETFEPSTGHGGEDSDGRSLRYLEWSYDPDPLDTTYITDYVVIFREGFALPSVEHDQHVLGLFSRDVWLNLLREAGFEAKIVVDTYDRELFVADKPRP
jgi:hypothetical protein